MRILILHNRYQTAGGEDGVVKAEYSLLKKHGHEVCLLEVSNDRITGICTKVSTAINGIYSIQAKQKVRAAIGELQPDLVHVHNFFPLLSPAVYDACLDAKVPVVQTLHNYRLGCPKAMPFRNNKICEDCFDQIIPWSAVVHGCYRKSRIQTAAVTTMIGLHRLRKTWQQRVDGYIALSEFQKRKLVQLGLPEERIFIKPNFAFVDEQEDVERGSFALFVGRLSEEKGVQLLIDAYRHHQLTLPLKIVGDGSLKPLLQEKAKEMPNISFLGRQSSEAVLQLMNKAQFLVFPSIWYEGFPLTIVEAYACKLPVIAPDLGTMGEIVKHGVTGLHFEPGNSIDLASKIQWAIEHPKAISEMGQAAHKVYQNCYMPEINYRQLINIYELMVNQKVSVQVKS